MGAGNQQPAVHESFAHSSMISQLYLHSASQAKPLRIGVMIDAFQIPAIFRQVLMDIRASDFASLELVILNQETQKPFRLRSVLYEAFQKRDRLQLPNPNPLEAVDCTEILGPCSRLDVNPIGKHSVHRFPSDAVAAIQAADLDVILHFGFRNLRGDVLTSARYGVWSFQYGDNEFYRGGPALFWEVVEDNPCSGVTLQVLTEKPHDGLVLCKSIFPTVRGHWPSRNSFQPYWGSSHFVIRMLHELHERGWNAVKQGAVPPGSYRGKAKIYRAPSDWQMAKWLVPKWLVPKVRNAVSPRNGTETEQIDQWRICLRRAGSPGLITGEFRDKSNFRWMQCPRGHFYADPMLIEHEGQVWMFFEDFVYKQMRGRIGCAPVRADGSIGEATVCLDLPYHLSYPFVFRHDGEIFMIPESYQNEGIELWRATNFPFSWKLEKTLFKGEFVDTTPVLHEGRWYFFTAPVERNSKPAFGALFSSDSLTGDWVHHPSSPISTDVRDARSAGAIVKVGNRLLRPVQDCAENYGRRIHVEEILELSPTAYRARRLHSIEPDWEPGLRGVHTYAHSAGFEVLDAVRLQDRHLLGAA
jgi:hypothetical protein